MPMYFKAIIIYRKHVNIKVERLRQCDVTTLITVFSIITLRLEDRNVSENDVKVERNLKYKTQKEVHHGIELP